jgi:ankyrin repeat protein
VSDFIVNLPVRMLREHTDLQQLELRASELLEAFRAGEPDATAEVNSHFPGAEIGQFALHDTQLVLARSYGFDSWPKLIAYVDGVTVESLVDAVRAGEIARVRTMLQARPELANTDMAENNEHRALHYAVLARAPEMVRVLMEHGADAHRGIYPHRAATTALTIARERGYDEIVAIIQEEEQRRRETQAPAGTAQDDVSRAIRSGDVAQAITLLEGNPALIDGADREGRSPLHMAAATLNEPLAVWLLDRGADVNRPGPHGRTPLDFADGAGWRRSIGLEKYPALAGLLRQRGAGLTDRSAVALGETAWLRARHAAGALMSHQGDLLSVAVRHDRPEMVSLLLDFGFDPNERTRLGALEEIVYSWGAPLHHCAGLGRHAIAKILLERGADPNGQVYASGSVLYSALAAGDDEMVKLLERYGGFADAATVGHLRLTARAKQMLDNDAAGRLPAGSYQAATLAEELLWAALRGGDPEIVRMALERMDWPRESPHWFGMLWSPLPERRSRADPEHEAFLACFRLILGRCDPDIRNPWFSRTILHDLAATDLESRPEETVAFATAILDAGARLDIRDVLLKSTPLGWACRWGRLEMVKLLLERGADPVEADSEPWASPMAWAVKNGREEVITALRVEP